MGVGGKLLKYLPKPTSFSIPNRSSKHLNKAATFSGPIASIVPKEARLKKKNFHGGFDTPEPTSPKVSCMGQVKHKNKNNSSSNDNDSNKRESKNKKIKPSVIQRMFTRKVRPGRPPVVPEVGKMRRFASGRGKALRDFEWRKETEHEEEEEVIVAHSAPITMGGGTVVVEKRKEVNLWKRRTCAPPVPLKVHGV